MTNERTAVLAVTGASGFIGRGVLQTLALRGVTVRGISRQRAPEWATSGIQWETVGSYTDRDMMKEALEGCDFVLHLADDPQRAKYRSVSEATDIGDALMDVAHEIRLSGLIVASSIYARLDTHKDTSYGAGKRAIEKCFLLGKPGIPVVILRLPPVYGPGGRGGVAALSQMVRRKLPLPLGLAKAPRNYLSRQNLCDLIHHMITASSSTWTIASGTVFEPSDGQPISTQTLVKMMAKELGVRERLLPVPVWALRIIGRLSNHEELIAGAVDPLDVDQSDSLARIYNWHAPEKMPESLSYLPLEASNA